MKQLSGFSCTITQRCAVKSQVRRGKKCTLGVGTINYSLLLCLPSTSSHQYLLEYFNVVGELRDGSDVTLKIKMIPSVICPSRAQGVKHTEKIYCTSAFWKPEDNLLYFLSDSCCLCPAEPVPSQVTDWHAGSCLHRDFSLPLRFPLAPNKTKRCCFAPPWRTVDRLPESLGRLFLPPIFFILSLSWYTSVFRMSRIQGVAFSIPTSSN